MKKEWVVVLLGIFVLSGICFADEEPLFNSNEFMGFNWGDNLKKNPRFECEYNHMQNETNCILKEGGLRFLGIDFISYYYLVNSKNAFDHVRIELKDRAEYDRLKENLVDKLGDQYIGDLAEGQIAYTWREGNLEIVLKDNNPEPSESISLFLLIYNKKFYLERASQTYNCSNLPCNVNRDDKCDDKDLKILDRSMGQCNKPGNYFYNSDADIDGDECITKSDRMVVENNLGKAGYVCKGIDLDFGI